MTRKNHFVDSFWDEDMCSDKGCKALVQKMIHSRATSKEILEYVTERAKIEEEYAKRIEDAGKILKGANENGSLKLVVNQLKQNASDLSNEHMSMSKTLWDQVQHLKAHTDSLRQKINQCEDTLKNSHKKMKDAYNKMQDAKRMYEIKCKEKESAEEQYSTMSGIASNTKEVEKLSKKSIDARESYRRADQNYRAMCNSLEVSRKQFEKDMESSCLVLEQAEESRIYTLINDLWTVMNVVSYGCVAVDKSNEEVRNVIRRCNVDKDIELSIESYGTGTMRPKEIPFVEYRFRDAGGYDSRTINRHGRPPLVGGATNSRS